MGTKPGSWIWMDGAFIPWDKASIHPLSNTVQYGMGVFEGLRSYEKNIFRLHDHTERLFQSAHILNIKIPYSKQDLNQAQIEAVEKNNLPASYIRPMVYYGSEYLGLHASDLKTHVMIAVWDMGDYIPVSSPDEGIKLGVSSHSRIHINSLLCKAKACGHYINSILAYKEAKAAGFDDALMTDAAGCIAEASSSNVFIVKKGVVYTPTDVSILNGITRDTVFSICKELGIQLITKNITRDELYISDEMFVTGTAIEIKAVAEVDGRKIGNGLRGPITKSIQNFYQELIAGRNPTYSSWVTSVPRLND